MGGKNVKNTIVERLMQFGAPHLCLECGKIGSVLCTYCKYDIVSEPFVGCLLCGKPELNGVCKEHESPIDQAFIVSMRHGTLKELIDGLKFRYMKAAAISAAELLHESLPLLPEDTLIVPIPTVRSHIRQRGYDQVALIAYHFARLRGISVTPLLRRVGNATQHHLQKEDRLTAAASAFELTDDSGKVGSAPILILDDIITTGSTVTEAAKLLATVGSPIIIGALAYQPLD
jgi:ComF family protein